MSVVLVLWTVLATMMGPDDCAPWERWDRRFAGCVQADCSSVEHAHYGHGGECVCSSAGAKVTKATDPVKKCTRPRDHPTCPGCVYKCVRKDQSCGETPKPKPKPKPTPQPLTCPEGAEPDADGERCWCGAGFEPQPVDGRCVEVEQDTGPTCGDGVCTNRRVGEHAAEDCGNCAQDCFCSGPGLFCAPPGGTVESSRCLKRRAQVESIGCARGGPPPSVLLTRTGATVELTGGESLVSGDRVKISSRGPKCIYPFVVLRWPEGMGRFALGPSSLSQEIKIDDSAIESGWPQGGPTSDESASSVAWLVRQSPLAHLFAQRTVGNRAARGLVGPAATWLDFLLPSPGVGSQDVLRIWLNSYVIVEQRGDGTMRVSTLEGAPEIARGDGDPIALEAGLSVSTTPEGLASPVAFEADEIAALDQIFSVCPDGTPRDGPTCAQAAAPAPAERLAGWIGYAGAGLIALSALGLAAALARR